MQHHALVSVATECGHDIANLLAEMEEEAELFGSPNTLAAVEQALLTMSHTLGQFSQPLRDHLVEVDWAGWQAVHWALSQQVEPRRELVWYAVQALVPATMGLLRRLWKKHPSVLLMP
ncbi:hypothetical protein [Aquabacterium sp.]|uniref:hypothetical protein n=1 Tax=Aquabacterium sp. TaxID=1872578 RepID=UPI0025BECFC1|nr:hypothetical protein [Aquabacterium sp.]